MQKKCRFFEFPFPNPLRRMSLSILVVLLGFLLFHAVDLRADDMFLTQVWRLNSESTASTDIFFSTDSLTGSGEEFVQVTKVSVCFKRNGNPYRWFEDPGTYWQEAQIVESEYPWPQKTILAQYNDGNFVGVASVDKGGNISVQILPGNWLGEGIAFYRGGATPALLHYTGNDTNVYLLEAGSTNLVNLSELPCVEPTAGIVSWWDGDSVSGTTVLDNQGINDGLLMGNATTVPGKVDQAFTFDGDGDHVNVGNDESLNLDADLTIEAWIKPADLDGFQAIVSKGDPAVVSYSSQEYCLSLYNKTLSFTIGNAEKTGTYISINKYIPGCSAGRWYHVAATVQGTTARLYVDGVEEASGSGTGTRLTADNFDTLIGMRNGAGPDLGFHGEIDEVRINNTAWTQPQIEAIYNSGSGGVCKDPPNQPPVAQCKDMEVPTSGEFIVIERQDINNGSFDPDGDPITLSISNPGPLAVGVHEISLFVEDDKGASDSCTATVTVVLAPTPPPPTAADKDYAGSDADPVSTYTGELYNQFSPDINLGGPIPLYFSRYYASLLKKSGINGRLGDNWRHSFEWSLTVNSTEATIISHKGRRITFSYDGASWDLTGTLNVPFQFTPSGSDYILYNPRTGLLHIFNSAGALIGIEDGKGNSHTLAYNGSDLATVSDGLGRMLTFSYSSGKLSTITDGTRTVGFAYTDNNLTTVTDLMGNDTVYTYTTGGLMISSTLPESNTPFSQTWNNSGQVDSQTDSDSNTTSFAYVGSETIITDALGKSRTHNHTVTGELDNSQDRTGKSVVIGSDETGRRNSITDRLGDVTTMTYHAASGKLASKTNADSTETSFTYTGRVSDTVTKYDLTEITHADTTTESYTYDVLGNLISRTDQLGNTDTFTYNSNGQLLTITNKVGGSSSFTYNPDATLATSKDIANNITTYTYDTFKRLSKVTKADGSTASFTYNNANDLESSTDENGNTVTLSYDANGNLVGAYDALDNTTAYTYGGNDQLLSAIDPLGGISSLTYDVLGREETATDANNNVTTFGYDILNRLTSITDPRGKVWSSDYDSEGIVVSRTDPLGNTFNYDSDKMGRITQISSPLDHVSSVTYDSMGRIATITNPLDEATTLSRDDRGRLSELTLPGGSITSSYTRNELGQITKIVDPIGSNWLRSYDTSGRQISSTDPLSQTTSMAYDNRNRLSKITFPTGIGTQTLVYDPAENLTSISYSDGTTFGFTYDKNNRLISANNGGSTPNNIAYAYDANGRISSCNGISIIRDAGGRITSMALAPGKTINYDYDENENVIQISDWAGGETSFVYDDADRLIGINRPNGVDTFNTWDADSRLVGISEGAISNLSLTRDGNGQITTVARNIPLEPVHANSTDIYSFDSASQVSTYTYDRMGRLTNDGTYTYIWDLASRLIGYTGNGTAVTCSYDALGRRTSRSASAASHQYVWNDALGIFSISVEIRAGSDFRYFIHTPGGNLLYSIEAATNARSFYHYDEMGNTIFVTDDSGTVIGSYAYSPYGELAASTGSLDNPFTWQGKFGVMDESNGLYYKRARYYDGATGRFISRDPVESIHPQEVNPYQYALGNPKIFIDPLGNESALVTTYKNIARAFRATASQLSEAMGSEVYPSTSYSKKWRSWRNLTGIAREFEDKARKLEQLDRYLKNVESSKRRAYLDRKLYFEKRIKAAESRIEAKKQWAHEVFYPPVNGKTLVESFAEGFASGHGPPGDWGLGEQLELERDVNWIEYEMPAWIAKQEELIRKWQEDLAELELVLGPQSKREAKEPSIPEKRR